VELELNAPSVEMSGSTEGAALFMLWMFVTLLLFHAAAYLTGNFVAVSDGDAIAVLVEKTQINVRLEGIDCPVSKQLFGQKAAISLLHSSVN
jgi:endonuclease YncB( thermonuclease family)